MDGRFERKWIFGGPWDIWIRYARLANELVREFDLKPVTIEGLRGGKVALEGNTEGPVPVFRPRPFPGGLRAAHLHLGDDIFLLKEEQWTRFTEKVMGDLVEKLSNARNIKFEQMMDVADAVEGLS